MNRFRFDEETFTSNYSETSNYENLFYFYVIQKQRLRIAQVLCKEQK